MARRVELPAAPLAPKSVAKLFSKAIGKHATVEAMTKHVRALGAALAKDAASEASIVGEVQRLARALGELDPLTKLSKAKRIEAFARLSELEILASALRSTGDKYDRMLATLATAIADGSARGMLAFVLRGGQIELAPSTVAELAGLFESSTDEGVLRAAFGAFADASPAKAQQLARRLLKAGKDSARIPTVLQWLDQRADEHADWDELVFPLTASKDRSIRIYASGFTSESGDNMLRYVAWAGRQKDISKAVEVIGGQLYWAWIKDRSIAEQLVAPLAALRARAKPAAAATLDRALKKIGVVLGAPKPAVKLGKKLASVGTEGGPPLVVDAGDLAAWQGALGPEPFDSGKSDYERATKQHGAHMIAIGKGQGVVLDEQGVDVYAEPTGLLMIASGAPSEEVAKGWKRLGVIEVGGKGIVVLDAAESGKGKGTNRAKVKLAAGRYEVRAHRPAGFGGDYSAVRLARSK